MEIPQVSLPVSVSAHTGLFISVPPSLPCTPALLSSSIPTLTLPPPRAPATSFQYLPDQTCFTMSDNKIQFSWKKVPISY